MGLFLPDGNFFLPDGNLGVLLLMLIFRVFLLLLP